MFHLGNFLSSGLFYIDQYGFLQKTQYYPNTSIPYIIFSLDLLDIRILYFVQSLQTCFNVLIMSCNPDKTLFLWELYRALSLAISQLWGWLWLQNSIWIYKTNIRIMSSIDAVSTRINFRSLGWFYSVSALIVWSYSQGFFIAVFSLSLNDISNNLRHKVSTLLQALSFYEYMYSLMSHFSFSISLH